MDLYYFNCEVLTPEKSAINAADTGSNLKNWHQCGHLNVASSKKLANRQLYSEWLEQQ